MTTLNKIIDFLKPISNSDLIDSILIVAEI